MKRPTKVLLLSLFIGSMLAMLSAFAIDNVVMLIVFAMIGITIFGNL